MVGSLDEPPAETQAPPEPATAPPPQAPTLVQEAPQPDLPQAEQPGSEQPLGEAASPPPDLPNEPPVPATSMSEPPATPPEGRKLPFKAILLGLAALLLVGILVFLVRQFILPRTKIPEEITLTYWGLWEEAPIIEGVIADYEAQNEGVNINYIKQAKEDYRERLVNGLAKGAGPDIFRYHNTWVPMLSSELSVLPAEVMDAGTYQQTFYPVASQTLRSGANIVGIPLMFDGLALYINEDLFAAAGATPPKTWDELRSLASRLTVKDEQGNIQQAGVALGRTENVDHWQDILALMMLQNGVDLANPMGQLAEDALTFFTVFATTDRVWDETLPPSTQAFSAGKLAMYFGPSWRAHEIKKASPQLRFKILPVPQLPASENQEVTWASFWAEGVWSRSEHKKEAWEFLKYLSTKTVLQKMYQEASKMRLFGEPYPRPDMAQLLENDPLVGAYIKQAPTARSWYLTSRTFDGPTGINSSISAYFEDAVNGVVNERKDPADVLPTVARGVSEALSRLGGSR